MSNEEMDRAIAEFLGWKCVEVYKWDESTFPPTKLPKQFHIRDGKAVGIPRYSTDLNAMREAEQALFLRDWGLRDVFIDHLCRIVNPARGYWMQRAEDIIDATALDRAKAFVETIKLIKQ